jgi:hypothetical protein
MHAGSDCLQDIEQHLRQTHSAGIIVAMQLPKSPVFMAKKNGGFLQNVQTSRYSILLDLSLHLSRLEFISFENSLTRVAISMLTVCFDT